MDKDKLVSREKGSQTAEEKKAQKKAAKEEKKRRDDIVARFKKLRDNELVPFISNAPEDTLKAIAQDKNVMIGLAKRGKVVCSPVYDKLFSYVTSRTALKKMIQVRFGIRMGSGAHLRFKKHLSSNDIFNEKSFDINGLRESYKTFLLLPQSHLDELRVVTTTNTQAGSSGYSLSTGKGVNVEYNKQDTKGRIAADGFMYNADDLLVGQNEFRTTLAHEIGHNTDHASHKNEVYSNRDDFRDLFGWNHASEPLGTRKDPNLIGKIIEISGASIDNATDDQKKLGKDIAHKLLSKDKYYKNLINAANNKSTRTDMIEKALGETSKKALDKAYKNESVKDVANKFSGSKLFIVVCKGVAEASPWLKEKADSPSPRYQVHEGYENQQWYKYDGTQRNQKYSNYAFRDPCESFAEMYAAYFVSGGVAMIPEHKVWFENNVTDARTTVAGRTH